MDYVVGITLGIVFVVGFVGMLHARRMQSRLFRLVKRHREELAESLMALYQEQREVMELFSRQTLEIRELLDGM